jgi:8-oxo-dGTP diphosphatase
MQKTITSLDIHGAKYEVPVEQLIWRPAAYAIVINDGKILLTRQHDALHLPGGGVDLGEMPDAATIRETQEETGIIVANPRLVDVISGFFTLVQPSDHTTTHVQSILMYYQCDLVGGELSIDGFEYEEKLVGEMPEWVPLEQLDHITAGSTIDWRSVVKQVIG